MKKYARFVVSVLVLSLLMTSALIAVPKKADAAIGSWQTGASIQSRFAEDFASDSFKKSINNLKNTGANYVTLIIPYYQSNAWSTDVAPGWNTPSDQTLASAIQYVHSQGMSVILKPHVDSYDGQWRASINPGDRDTWFKNYGAILNHLADIAKANGVEGMSVGAELINMSTASANSSNTQNWEKLISSVRSRYPGFLTYSANWGGEGFPDEKNRIEFWGSLDYIGISAYFNLHSANDVQSLKNAWDGYNQSQIKPLSTKYGKQVLFTEVGYRSINDAHTAPWDHGRGGSYDPTEQANDYAALFDYWNGQSFMTGVHLWDWSSDPNVGGNGNLDYTPQNKPAEGVMKQWFSGSGSSNQNNQQNSENNQSGTPVVASTTLAVSPADAKFVAAAAITPAEPANNQPATISVAVSAQVAASNVIIDVEVYDASNSRVFQQFFSGQNITPSQATANQFSWTPQNNGAYSVKVGIFSHDWMSNYYWNDSVLTFSVGSGGQTSNTGGTGSTGGTTGELTSGTTPDTTPTTQTNYTTNVWWPGEGVSVQGAQPFKAMLEGLDVGQYSMFWQVDGDRLNEMYNSSEDYPHKEAWVDLGSWNWKGSGPYNINFVSKNPSGTVISQKSLNLSVQQ